MGHSLFLRTPSRGETSGRTSSLLTCHVLYMSSPGTTQCYCGDASDDLDKYCDNPSCSNADCDKPCSGDGTQICGGLWSMSVYTPGKSIVYTELVPFSHSEG